MKPIITFLVTCLITTSTWATVFTVSNNPTYPAQYNTIQPAVTTATTGDTIYIYPSPTLYNEIVNITKRLVFIGGGVNPQRPSRLPSFVNTFSLTATSASGSVFMGLTFYSVFTCGNDPILVNNVIVSDCRFTGNASFYGDNLLIENCIFSYTSSTGAAIQITSYSSGNIVQNNYFHGYLALRPGTNTIIRNNIFASGDANTVAFSDLQHGETFGPNVRIWNNIFYKSDPVGPRGVSDGCEFKNNIYYLTGDPVPVNPLSSGNLNADPQFVNFPVAGAIFSFDYDFHLLPSSPAINYGTDGKDAGMWGGPAPVNAGFEPPIPRIYDLKVNNATVPAGGTIQLTIKATKAQ